MTLANPYALFWALAAGAIWWLYRRRIGVPRQSVATAMFWEQALAEEGARSRWQPRRHAVSLGVQLAILLLFVLAMTDPLIPGPRHGVLIIDNGAGMQSRLPEAKQAASRLVAELRDCDRVAVLSAGEAVGVCCPLTNDPSVLQSAVDSITATDGSDNINEAVEVARRMLADEPDARIIVLSDGVFEAADTVKQADDVEIALVGQPVGNTALTRFAIRRLRSDATKCQVLVEAASAADTPTNYQLEVLLDRRALATESFTMASNGRWQKIFELAVPESGRLTARLAPADDYPTDNTMVRDLPPPNDSDDTPGFNEIEVAATDLRVAEQIGTPAKSVPPLVGSALRPWPYLLAVAVLLLAAEWALYQRRWLS